MAKRIHGESADHQDISRTLNNLGEVARKRRDDDDALKLYWHSLEIRRRIHGNDIDHIDISRTLNNLGCTGQRRL